MSFYRFASRSQARCFATAAALALGVSAQGGVITDPTLSTGPDALDPVAPAANPGTFDATGLVTGAASKATLTGLSGFGVVQNYVGFTPAAANPSLNYLSFTDPGRPDVRISSTSYNGSRGTASQSATTSGPANGTGSGTDQFIGSGGYSANAAQTIEFGTYDAGTGTFTADKAVSAVGFMITQSATATAARTWTATFYDATNQVIATQTSAAGAGTALLFGLSEAGNTIRRVQLGITGGGDAQTFMDDLGFATVIPEPGSVTLASLGALALLARRRRA